jgi:hypothetical protein
MHRIGQTIRDKGVLRLIVLLRQRCVSGKSVAATVRSRQLKRTDYATNKILSDRS